MIVQECGREPEQGQRNNSSINNICQGAGEGRSASIGEAAPTM